MKRTALKLLVLSMLCVGLASATPIVAFQLVVTHAAYNPPAGPNEFNPPSGTHAGNSTDFPLIVLRNTTTGGFARISSWTMTVGKTAVHNFDRVATRHTSSIANGGQPAGTDTTNAGTRADSFTYTFSGNTTASNRFDLQDYFAISTELDLDTGDSSVDYRNVFWNNGDTDVSNNALVTVVFSSSNAGSPTLTTNRTLSFRLPDQLVNNLNTYTFDVSAAVPEPSTLALASMGIVAVLVSRLRRAKR